jgi:DNA-binding NarL/FixJ family response regulator
MPAGDGLEILEKLRKRVSEAKVVKLSTFDNPTHFAQVAALGARTRFRRIACAPASITSYVPLASYILRAILREEHGLMSRRH